MAKCEYQTEIPPQLDKGGPQKFGALLDQNITAMLNDVGASVHTDVRKPIVQHSGTDSLYNSIKLDRASGGSALVRVATSSPKAIWREVDTKPHVIVPKRARVLRFIPRGGTAPVFTMHVNHPGTRGTHSWQHGGQAMKMRLQWGCGYALEASLKESRYTNRYS